MNGLRFSDIYHHLSCNMRGMWAAINDKTEGCIYWKIWIEESNVARDPIRAAKNMHQQLIDQIFEHFYQTHGNGD